MHDKEAVLRRLNRTRVPHYHPNFPLILFWSQKSGCTGLAKWFFFQIGLLEQALQYSPWIHTYEHEKYITQPNHKSEIIENLAKEKKDTFKLVRNPYKRAVSQFLILATTKGITNWDKEWEKIRTYFFQDKNAVHGISFKQFLYYIKDANGYDDHFNPQYLEGEELFVNNYIYLERFHDHISEIEKRYGLRKSNLSSIGKSSHHLSSSMILTGNYADMKITNETFSKSGKYPTYDSFYDKETTNLVNTIFSKDFEVYGYQKRY